MYNTNRAMLWAVKLVVTAFNIPDTWYAFSSVFSKTDRPEKLKIYTIIMAIFAIDIVFLWVLSVLEEYLHPLKKLPYALAAVLFAIFSVWIGFKSEGDIIAFVPRIGLLMVVFIYLTAFVVDLWDHYLSAEQVEHRMKDSKDKKLRRVDRNAYENVLDNEGLDWLEETHSRRLRKRLGIQEVVAEYSAPIEPVHQQPMAFIEPPKEDLPDYIYETQGGYGWESPDTGECFELTSTQNPYTLIGAKIALSRYKKEHAKNGQHAF